jgi:WD40 repeat protein
VFDATTGDLLYRRQMEAGPWHSTVEWSPDGRFLAVSSRSGSEPRDSRFELLNAGDGSNALIRRFRDKEVVRTSAFLKDGSRLALASQVVPQNKLDIDPTEIPQAHIELIDTSNGQTLETLVAPRGSLYSIQFSPDGKTLATSGTGAAYLWDVSHLK